MDSIEAFFDVLNDKVVFLRQLFDSQRQDEAMTLCWAVQSFERCEDYFFNGQREEK